MSLDKDNKQTERSKNVFAAAISGTLVLGIVAFGLSYLLGTPIGPQLKLSANDVLIGVIATLPPAVFLWWFSKTEIAFLAEFRHSQIKFFAEIGFEFTLPRIIVMSIAAGVAEELLFRGVIQTWFVNFMPVIAALLASNVIFGLLHMRTALYAAIAGVIGIYLGALYLYTDNLLAPMVTHALYDFIALYYTKIAISKFRTEKS